MSEKPAQVWHLTRNYFWATIHDYDAYTFHGQAHNAPRRFGVFFVMILPGRVDRAWMEYFHTLKAAKAAIRDWTEGKEELLHDMAYNARYGRF